MLLSDLPPEIILVIADSLPQEGDINALAVCARHLYAILNPYLYRHNVLWHNSSSLFWAARHCETNTVRLALDLGGADVNVREGSRSLNDGTPFYKTIEFWAATKLPRLHENRYGAPEAKRARNDGDALLMLLLERGADVNAMTRTKLTPLHHAARTADERLVRLLLENGADLHARDRHDDTVLHTAAVGGDDNIVRLLIEQGLSVHETNKFGQTPLHRASYEAKERSVRVLIEHGADVEAKDSVRATPLHCAVSHSRFDTHELRATIELLLEKGADIEARNLMGCTPLHDVSTNRVSSHAYFESLALFLMDKGARIDIHDNNGHTVYRDGMRRYLTKLMRLRQRSPRPARKRRRPDTTDED